MHDKGFGPHKTQFRRDENYGKLYSNPIFYNFGGDVMVEVKSLI